MADVDFIATVGNKQVLIEKLPATDEKKEAERLKAYAKAVAEAEKNG